MFVFLLDFIKMQQFLIKNVIYLLFNITQIIIHFVLINDKLKLILKILKGTKILNKKIL